jgi:hypothetical protein
MTNDNPVINLVGLVGGLIFLASLLAAPIMFVLVFILPFFE